jgi:hypothetical protein
MVVARGSRGQEWQSRLSHVKVKSLARPTELLFRTDIPFGLAPLTILARLR